jgi:hypothetical protein
MSKQNICAVVTVCTPGSHTATLKPEPAISTRNTRVESARSAA